MWDKALLILYRLFGGLFILWMAGLLLAVCGVGAFYPLLNMFGISLVGDRGIFVNCSKPENQKNDFCVTLSKRKQRVGSSTGPNTDSDSKLGDVEKGPGMPFSLSR